MTAYLWRGWLMCAIALVPAVEYSLRGVYGTEVAEAFACGLLQAGTLLVLLVVRHAGWTYGGGTTGWWVAAMLASAIVSAFASGDKCQAFPALGHAVTGVMVFFLAACLPRAERRNGARALALGLLCGGAVSGAFALMRMAGSAGAPENAWIAIEQWAPALAEAMKAREHGAGAFSFFLYPNLLGGYLILGLPLALTLGIEALRRGRKIETLVYGVLIAACAGGVTSSKSIGAAVSLVVAMIVVPVWRRSRVPVIFVAAIAALLMVSRQPAAMAGSTLARSRHWIAAARFAVSSPSLVLGTGPGTYGNAFGHSLPAGLRSRFAHSYVIETLVENGIVGLAVLATMLFMLVRVVGAALTPTAGPVVRGLAVGWTAWLLHSFIDIGYAVPVLAFPWWGVGGYLASCSEKKNGEGGRAIRLGAWLRFVPLTVLCLGLAALPLFQGARAGIAYSSILGLAVALAVWHGSGVPGRTPIRRGTDFGWLALLGLGTVWLGFSSAPGVTYTVILEGLGLLAIVIMVRRVSLVPGIQAERWMRITLMGSVGLYAVWGLAKAFGTGAPARAGFPSPNLFGAYLLAGIGLALAELRKKEGGWSISGVALAAVLGIALLATRSSGAWMAGGVLVASWMAVNALSSDRTRALSLAGAAVVLAGAGVVAIPAAESMSVSQRLTMWREAGCLIVRNPLGFGPGNYENAVASVRRPSVTAAGVGRYSLQARFAHSEPLHFAVEWGTPALGLLILGFMAAFLNGIVGTSPGWRWAAFALLVYSAVDFPLRAPPCKLFMAVAIGFMTVRGSPTRGRAMRGRNPRLEMNPVLALAAGSAIVCGLSVTRPALSRWLLESSEDWRQASLIQTFRARACYPANPRSLEVEGLRRWERWRARGEAIEAWKAREALERAYVMGGGDQDTGLNLGYVLLEFGQRTRYRPALKEAESIFSRTASNYPTSPYPWLGMARAFLAQRAPESAENALDDALAREPFFLSAMAAKGIAKEMKGEKAAARRVYRSVMMMHAELAQRKRMNPYEQRLIAIDGDWVKGRLLDLGSGR